MMTGGFVELHTDKMMAEKDNHIGWITFNNPARRNAVSLEMWEALGIILTDFEADAEIRTVVLKGAGGKSFVSGADISEFDKKRNSAAASEEYSKKAAQAQSRLYKLDKPLIAMIQGYCIGGGLAVALNADIRFATDDSKFGIPAAKLGLGYGYGGIKMLMDLVGPSHTKDILFSARFLSADEALHIGLINSIIPAAEMETAVREYAGLIADNAPLTIRAAKAAAREALKNPESRDLEKITKMVNACFDSEDYAEGRRAFMGKRKPVFKGR
jgi:enoyl-CoA hydratase/carnithine racemase